MTGTTANARALAHELNNVLTTVLGFGALLAERVAADPEAAEQARQVLAGAERAAVLTQRLLSVRQAPPVRASERHRTVLVVDDVEQVRRVLAETLRKAGYRVITAASASEALHKAGSRRTPIHLLLTDVVMRGSSGIDLARELRGDRPTLPVVYISGYAGAPSGPAGPLGPNEVFLQKPVNSGELLGRVAALLT